MVSRVLSACRTGGLRSRAALREWISLEDNPFLALAARRELRRGKPLQTLLGLCLLVGMFIGGGFYLQHLLLAPDALLSRDQSPFGSYIRATEGGFPSALGRNVVSFVTLVTVGMSAFFAAWAARTRASAPLRSASLGGSIEDWQLLPLSEERWVWMLAAYPFGVTLLCALVGLPVYALALFTGVWGVRDLLGVTFLFAWLGHIVPRWAPGAWQGRGARLNTKKYSKLVKEARGGRAMSELSPEERFEFERRVARALVESYDAPAPRRGRAGRGNTNQQGLIQIFATIGVVQIFVQVAVASLRAGGFAKLLPLSYREALPSGTLDLIPALPLTWPLIVARFLTAPFPFFALTLPPAALILPLLFAGYNVRFLALASQVSASETFWTRPRARTRRAWQATSIVLLIMLLVGYGWPLLITSGLMAKILVGAPLTQAAALAGGWTLFGVVGALIASGRALEEPFRQARVIGLASGRAWRESLVGTLASWGLALGLFLLFCLLGGIRSLGADWRAHALPVLLTCASFLTVEYGSVALKTSLPPHLRIRVMVVRALWFYGPLAVYALTVAYHVLYGRVVSPFDAPYLLLSPWVALVALFRYDLAAPIVPFALAWLWPALANFAFGGVMVLSAAAREFGGVRGSDIAPPEGSLWWDRFKSGVKRVVLWIVWVVGRIPTWIALGYEALVVAAIRPFERSENPILRDEMRRRLRREGWLIQWLAAIAVVVYLLWQFGWSLLTTSRTPGMLEGWGMTTLGLTLAGACIGALAGPVKLGVCFDRERSNGQLAFLFLTPLTEREILLGKWLPEIIHSLGLYAAALLPLILGTAALMFSGAIWALFAFVGILICMSVSLAWSTLAQLAAAVRARKSGEGANRAALAIFGFEFACFLLVSLIVYVFDLLNLEATPPVVGGVALLILALHVGVAYAAWRFALRWLRAARYGEGGSTGVVSN